MQWIFRTLFIILTCSHDVLAASIDVSLVARSDSECSTFPLPNPQSFTKTNSSSSPKGNNGTDDSTEWDPSAIRRREDDEPLSDTEWRFTVDRGTLLWGRLQRLLANPPLVDAPVCNIGDRWDVRERDAWMQSLHEPWNRLLPPGVVPQPQPRPAFFNVEITAPKARPDSEDPYSYDSVKFEYDNAYSPTYGIIKATSIVGIDTGSISAVGRRAPDRWSDVTWKYYKVVCRREAKDPKGLKWILQEGIFNSKTNAVQNYIVKKKYGDGTREERNDVWYPGSDEFLALLTTPNVVGTVYMLMQHVNEIGRKSIRSIGSYVEPVSRMYCLYIELGEPTAGGANPQSAGTIQTS